MILMRACNATATMRGVRVTINPLFVVIVIAAATSSILISFCNGHGINLCIESEREALLKLKHGLIDKTNRLSSWVEGGGDCCEWSGVVCNNITGHIIHLNLSPDQEPDHDYAPVVEWEAFYLSRLGGTISPSLVDLKHLSLLDLSRNNFGGIQIPEFISSINTLTYLDLNGASFGGAIPHQLGNLSKLQHLDLGNNHLSEAKTTLQWLSGLSALQYLDLSNANLSKATDWVEVVTNKLPSLVELHLSSCHLNNYIDPSPPVSTLNFTSLAVIDLSFNWFPFVPTFISSLPSLVSIDLSANRISIGSGVIPNGFKNMSSSLKFLDLNYNPVSASTIPTWLSNLYHLHSLSLRANRLQGNISSANIGNLSSLTHLDLSRNMLQGIEPKCLESLCRLRELDLSSNKFDHKLSEMVLEGLPRCSLDKLESLRLASNKLFGHLVDEMGELSSLKVLDVSNNRLSGTLSRSLLGQLGNLEALDIRNNMLEGNVSEMHFSNLTRLRRLMASNNNKLTFQPTPDWVPPFQCEMIGLGNWNLGPQFPHWLQFQQNLAFLDISQAQISSVIPNWFWNFSTHFVNVNLSHNQLDGGISYLPSCHVIDLSSNQLNGSLSPEFSPSIGYLSLSNNLFSGSLHHFVCDNSRLGCLAVEFLDLGSNLLTGLIPDCWNNWTRLISLSLENNNLSGEIPRSLASMTSLFSLNLQNNSLFGEVPPALQNCSRLHILDLGKNQLNGSISTWIGGGDKLSRLVVLNLRSNKFQYHIPTQICALQSLQILDLAYNNISGTIPNCLSNLSAMATSEPPYVGYVFSFWWRFTHDIGGKVILDALVVMRGREDEYSTTLGLVKHIDLSANELIGEIPKQLGNLTGLRSLTLSRNLLTGEIPESIGNMELLETLDLSINRLHGEIPSSLSNLNFLSRLNLSYNNLTGLIPTGTQLQGFDNSSYIGNHLCGPPLAICSSKTPNVGEGGPRKSPEVNGVHVSIVVGLVMGFWGVVAPLLFIRSWRIAYYRKLDHIGRQLHEFWATFGRR